MPDQITFFLVAVWILSAIGILVPVWAGIAATVLLMFMMVAFVTLLFHHEFRRLIEPAVPIVLLTFVAVVRSNEILNGLSAAASLFGR